MHRPSIAAGIAALALAFALAAAARAGAAATAAPVAAGSRSYAVTGSDSFAVGEGDVTSDVAYRGTQRLVWKPRGTAVRYDASVDYTRTEQGNALPERAHYVSDLTASGEQRDALARDPEYLSVLNQPFSVRLDLPTLKDLRRLRTDVPFDFPSPMTGSTMRGRLRHVGEAVVDGRPAVGVGFAASGSMSGALPGRPGLSIRGAIVLRGTAYYDAATALLLSSETTVTIVGNVSNPGNTDAVHITYARAIRSGTLSAEAVPTAAPAPAFPSPVPVPT